MVFTADYLMRLLIYSYLYNDVMAGINIIIRNVVIHTIIIHGLDG